MTLAPYAMLIAAYFGRQWVTERIKRSVQHEFDEKIEEVRSAFRKGEEQFKAELQRKESEISGLRTWVLNGVASRQTLLDKRRFEAVERVWTGVNDLAPLKFVASVMMHIDFKETAKHAGDPKIQKFLGLFGSDVADPSKQKADVARDERPFLTEPVWAYYKAYRSVLTGSLARFIALKVGSPGIDRIMTNEPTKKILKAAMPHATQFIDEQEPDFYYLLLDEIEGALLAELRKMLDGTDVDRDSTIRARAVMNAVSNADQERAKEIVEDAGGTPMTCS